MKFLTLLCVVLVSAMVSAQTTTLAPSTTTVRPNPPPNAPETIKDNLLRAQEELSITHEFAEILLSPSIVIHDENSPKAANNKDRRVSFASNQLARYLEPINPFESLDPISSNQELSNLYCKSCEKHSTPPIASIIEHLEAINLNPSAAAVRAEVLNLKNETLSHDSCEALEELFKRVKYRSIDLTSCSLDDISATAIFDMIEYYEATNELNISENSNIKNRGWQSCINMIKRSQALHSLSTRGTLLSDNNALNLGNALLTSYIYTLKLEHCGLSGRPIFCLGGALQKNKILKELCLANNDLKSNDALHIADLLRLNCYLQLLDISNNDIQDKGCRYLTEALSYQSDYVSKNSTTNDNRLATTTKFDFGDLTTNLNNINNNRHRSPTPTPKIEIDATRSHIVVRSDSEPIPRAPATNNNNNNNNNNNSSIPLRKSTSSEIDAKSESMTDNSDSNKEFSVAISSTKPQETTTPTSVPITTTAVPPSAIPEKFLYTTASLSPISHGYDDTTTNHNVFNVRSPERSFSSESLCSETSIESNDSKSSIRLIETKFTNKNGTLERQSSSHPTTLASNEKKPTGLQVLILWNNNLTKKCATCFGELLESTDTLEILNIGQNVLTNHFLTEIKSSIKLNKSLNSLGLQSSHLNCDGLKTLSEILQFGGNLTLQRIDLRSNEISIFGLQALSEALNNNKTIIRIDLDDAPKNIMIPMFDNNSEYQRLISTIRAQCSRNENPPEPTEVATKSTTPIQVIKRKPYMNSRKISLTCPNVKVISKSLPDNQLLDPLMKRCTSGRLRSPSPSPSPNSSPLPSPSRSRFQVSKVSESANKFTSSASPSPSSSSGSPTFFPPHSRFRVTVIPQPTPSAPMNIATQTNFPLNRESSILDRSKEIDIPKKVAPKIESSLAANPVATSFLNISNSSMLSSQSCEQLDYEVKRTFIDMDSCSSFSSSIESIDHQTDLSLTESFDLLDKFVPTIEGEDKRTRDILSDENTIISTSSSSSNEGLTLTTNSPTSSPKQEQKRVRKTSWIHSAIGSTGKNENIAYPATLDKLLNLFQHPTSLFTKAIPEPTVMTTSMSSTLSNKPKCTTQSRETVGVKENSISGLIHSFINLTHNKKDDLMPIKSGGSCTILQNISPENTVGKATNSQMIIESLPKSVKKELKENISPENTISCDNIVGIETSVPKSQLTSKVLFLMGDESVDDQDCDIDMQTTSDVIIRQDSVSDDLIDLKDPEQKSLGDITRDSLSILKLRDNDSNLQLSTDDSHLQNQTM
ncbi:unnamed protein product [Diamesa serratosioi]